MWHQSQEVVDRAVASGYIEAMPHKLLLGLRSAVREDSYRFDLNQFMQNPVPDPPDALSNEGMAKRLLQTGNVEFMWSIPLPNPSWLSSGSTGEHTRSGYPWQKAAYYAAYVQYMLQPADMSPAEYGALNDTYNFWVDDGAYTTPDASADAALHHNWGNLRARRGHPDPYPIRFIMLGIEPYGEAQESYVDANGRDDAATYGQIAESFRAAIRSRQGACATIPLGLCLNQWAPTELDSSNRYFTPLVSNCTISDFSYFDLYHYYTFGDASDPANVIAQDYPNATATDPNKTWFYPDLAGTRPSDVPYQRWLWQIADLRKRLSTFDANPNRWKIGWAEHGLVISSPYGAGDDLKGGVHWALWLSEIMEWNTDWDVQWGFMEMGMSHCLIVVRDSHVTRTPAYFVYQMAMQFQGLQYCPSSFASSAQNSGTYDNKPYVSSNFVVKTFFDPATSHYHLFVINKDPSDIALTGWEAWNVVKWDQIHSDNLSDMNQIGLMKPSTTTWSPETIITRPVTPPSAGSPLSISHYSINHIELSDGSSPASPAVQSFTIASSNASSVTYQLTFNQSVTGVDAPDFTASGAGGASVTGLSATGSGVSYNVVVNYSGTSGTINLSLNSSGTGITNSSGQPLASGATAPTFTVGTSGGGQPTITLQPSSNQSITVNQSVSYSITATDNNAPIDCIAFFWEDPDHHQSWDGSTGTPTGLTFSGATSQWTNPQASLSLSPFTATATRAGRYVVMAGVHEPTRWVYGPTFYLDVAASSIPPSITTQPQSQTVNVGANVTFTVAADGTAPLSYQWRKNGNAISGATAATLTLSNVQPADAGSYAAVVTNSAGSATSNSATLTVNSDPTITLTPSGTQSLGVNQSITYNLSAVDPTAQMDCIAFFWQDPVGHQSWDGSTGTPTGLSFGSATSRWDNPSGSLTLPSLTVTPTQNGTFYVKGGVHLPSGWKYGPTYQLIVSSGVVISMTPASNQTISVGQSITYSTTCSDSSGQMDCIAFYWEDPDHHQSWDGSTGTPNGLTFDGPEGQWDNPKSSGSRTITATATRAGTYSVKWAIHQANGGWTTGQTYQLTVQ